MRRGKARGRRAVFWLTIAGVAISADLAVHMLPRYVRSPGLARLAHHMGGH